MISSEGDQWGRYNLPRYIEFPLNPANEAPDYAKIRDSCMRKRDLLPSMTKLHLNRNAPSQHAQKPKNKRALIQKKNSTMMYPMLYYIVKSIVYSSTYLCTSMCYNMCAYYMILYVNANQIIILWSIDINIETLPVSHRNEWHHRIEPLYLVAQPIDSYQGWEWLQSWWLTNKHR